MVIDILYQQAKRKGVIALMSMSRSALFLEREILKCTWTPLPPALEYLQYSSGKITQR